MVPPNGEISRVFGDAPAFYAPRRRVFHQTIWNKGHSEITLVGQRPLRGTVYSRISGNFAYLCPVGPFQQETAGVQDLAG